MRAELFWIDVGASAGGLAIAPRPRGGDWLLDEIAEWASAGVEHVVSMLTPEEESELELQDEERVVRGFGLRYSRLPVEDRGVPSSRREVIERARTLHEEVARGGRVLIHCRQGVGRSSLLAAAVLMAGGAPAEAAFRRVEAGRGRPVPDTEEQRLWLGR